MANASLWFCLSHLPALCGTNVLTNTMTWVVHPGAIIIIMTQHNTPAIRRDFQYIHAAPCRAERTATPGFPVHSNILIVTSPLETPCCGLIFSFSNLHVTHIFYYYFLCINLHFQQHNFFSPSLVWASIWQSTKFFIAWINSFWADVRCVIANISSAVPLLSHTC